MYESTLNLSSDVDRANFGPMDTSAFMVELRQRTKYISNIDGLYVGFLRSNANDNEKAHHALFEFLREELGLLITRIGLKVMFVFKDKNLNENNLSKINEYFLTITAFLIKMPGGLLIQYCPFYHRFAGNDRELLDVLSWLPLKRFSAHNIELYLRSWNWLLVARDNLQFNVTEISNA